MLNSTGNVVITSGEISSSGGVASYGIYNNNIGNIILGVKDDGIISQENPKVTSGIHNNSGKLFFYDGKITSTSNTIIGDIVEIENYTEINITDEITNKVLTLQRTTTNAARVNGTEYDSIQKAVIACGTEESTIEILRDSDPGATVIIEENQNITIDLNGYIINNYTEMQNKGTLTIKDSSSGVYNSVSGTVNVESGTVSSNTYGIYNYSSSSTANVNGGTISSNTYGIYNAGGTTNIKEGAEIQSDIGIYAAGGRINIGETGTMNSNSPIITGETYGLSVTTAGIVYMYDGQIKGKTGATQGFITYTESGYAVANKIEGEYFVDYLALAGTVNTVAEVNGVSYSNLQSAINSIIGEETQTIKLTNIDATGSGVGKITSTTGTAIINSGTLTLGQDDGTVNQDFITIEGRIYGIETTGELNFYDGTINGSSAVSGTVTNRPSGYVIRTTTVNGKERYYLTI